MESLEYEFQPKKENLEGTENKAEKIKQEGLSITIVGSLENSPEQNKELFGKYIADKIASEVKLAQQENKKLVFDAPTGGTPKPIWSELTAKIEKGELNFSNVIVMGHEEVWRSDEAEEANQDIPNTYVENAKLDTHRKKKFDNFRRKEILENNNIDVKPITQIEEVSKEKIEGNFIPMHLSNDPKKAVEKYSQIVNKLVDREDVKMIGVYGVGTDGHIGEIQIQTMGRKSSSERKHVYSDPRENYSIEKGSFRWQKDNSKEFNPEENIFWQRKDNEEKNVGRTMFDSVVGLGWKEMLKNDKLILAFNDQSKALAFKLAIEGSIDGEIKDKEGKVIKEIKRDKGEGEKIITDLEKYAIKLEKEGILEKGTVDKNRKSNDALRCRGLFKAIYEKLDEVNASYDDPRYQEMWKFTNRYIGKRAPVSRLIRMRSILGKETEIVATPQVIKGTEYEELIKK